MSSKERFTCIGSVRRKCRVRHRSLRAAARCCRRDHLACARIGGYSDRVPWVETADGYARLPADDLEYVQDVIDGN